ERSRRVDADGTLARRALEASNGASATALRSLTVTFASEYIYQRIHHKVAGEAVQEWRSPRLQRPLLHCPGASSRASTEAVPARPVAAAGCGLAVLAERA